MQMTPELGTLYSLELPAGALGPAGPFLASTAQKTFEWSGNRARAVRGASHFHSRQQRSFAGCQHDLIVRLLRVPIAPHGVLPLCLPFFMPSALGNANLQVACSFEIS